MEGDDKIDVNVEVNQLTFFRHALGQAWKIASHVLLEPTPAQSMYKMPSGFFRKTVDEADCQQCGLGQYGSVEGLVQCVECQKGMYTMSKGSLAVASCLTCASGRFNDEKGLTTQV